MKKLDPGLDGFAFMRKRLTVGLARFCSPLACDLCARVTFGPSTFGSECRADPKRGCRPLRGLRSLGRHSLGCVAGQPRVAHPPEGVPQLYQVARWSSLRGKDRVAFVVGGQFPPPVRIGRRATGMSAKRNRLVAK
jgi:hypothetical protein